MLYICVPTYNEAPTVGVLLWRIRKMFQDYSREYEVLVYDDASTDATSEVLTPYADVLPLRVLRGEKRLGYGQALQALCREASRRTHYARRDAMVVMQGDFTDQPDMLPELVKRFEGGADIVVAERSAETMPLAVRRLSRVAPWMIRPFIATNGVADPFNSFRLYRLSLLRELLKAGGDAPIITTDGWAANVELLVKLMPLARKIETVSVVPRYDLRPRESRIRPLPDAWSLYKYTKQSRRWRAKVSA
ncbi:MAG TPA: glycosyltransferase family 2 protein [Gemmatimonadaceae bacterium]|jgi:glycosyltransferase involved in cell wall biosynthesis|nr:glycosyltransferase family 2 protein [Gemmatimonadaceae bacterium]